MKQKQQGAQMPYEIGGQEAYVLMIGAVNPTSGAYEPMGAFLLYDIGHLAGQGTHGQGGLEKSLAGTPGKGVESKLGPYEALEHGQPYSGKETDALYGPHQLELQQQGYGHKSGQRLVA